MHASTIQAVAAALRGRRADLGWSQADTAAIAGTSRKFVSEIEAGKETAELGKVLALAEALGLEVTLTVADRDARIPINPAGALDALLDDYLRGDDS